VGVARSWAPERFKKWYGTVRVEKQAPQARESMRRGGGGEFYES